VSQSGAPSSWILKHYTVTVVKIGYSHRNAQVGLKKEIEISELNANGY